MEGDVVKAHIQVQSKKKSGEVEIKVMRLAGCDRNGIGTLDAIKQILLSLETVF